MYHDENFDTCSNEKAHEALLKHGRRVVVEKGQTLGPSTSAVKVVSSPEEAKKLYGWDIPAEFFDRPLVTVPLMPGRCPKCGGETTVTRDGKHWNSFGSKHKCEKGEITMSKKCPFCEAEMSDFSQDKGKVYVLQEMPSKDLISSEYYVADPFPCGMMEGMPVRLMRCERCGFLALFGVNSK